MSGRVASGGIVVGTGGGFGEIAIEKLTHWQKWRPLSEWGGGSHCSERERWDWWCLEVGELCWNCWVIVRVMNGTERNETTS